MYGMRPLPTCGSGLYCGSDMFESLAHLGGDTPRPWLSGDERYVCLKGSCFKLKMSPEVFRQTVPRCAKPGS